MKIKAAVLGLSVLGAGILQGCISTPFEVVGEVVGASFEAAGAVASAPFAVAGAAVEVPFELMDASWEGNAHLKKQLEISEEWDFDAESIQKINADTRNGSIVVNATDGSRIYVEAKTVIFANQSASAERYANSVHANPQFTGEHLNIQVEIPRPPRHTFAAVHLTLYTPPHVALNLRSTNGKIEIEGIEADIEAITTNGGIATENTQGSIHARTTNGKIELQRLSGSFQSVTTNGSVRIHALRLSHASSVDTVNAGIHLEVEDGVVPLKLTTTNGSVDAALPASFHGTLDAKTTNGRVSSEFPVSVYEAKKNRLQGQMNGGGETEVYIRSTNGSIRLRQFKPIYATASR